MHLKELFLVALSLIIIFIVFYNSPVLHNFWMYDDLYVLKFATDYSFFEYIFNPHIWSQFSSANITPLVIVSYAFDYFIFDFSPQGFYLHSLLALFILSLLTYMIMRMYISIGASLCGLLFLISSQVFAASSEILMFRHYIEGAVFSCLSVLFYIVALRSNRFYLTILTSIFYLLAMLCKEVYIPLIIIFVFLPEGYIGQRLKKSVLPFFALGIYFSYRSWMLGSIVGGYSGSYSMFDIPAIFSQIYTVGSYLQSAIIPYDQMIITYLALTFLIFIVLINYIQNKDFKNFVFVLCCIISIVVPLLPISSFVSTKSMISYRFAFPSGLLCAVLIGVACSYVTNITKLSTSKYRVFCPKLIFALLAIMIIPASWANHQWIKQRRIDEIRPLTAENIFLWTNSQPKVLIRSTPTLGVHYYKNLAYFHKKIKGSPPPTVIAHTYGLFSEFKGSNNRESSFYSYDPDAKTIIEITSQMGSQHPVLQQEMNRESFHIDFRLSQGVINLDLETDHTQGRFFMLLGYRPGVYCDALVFPPTHTLNFESNFFAHMVCSLRFGWDPADEGQAIYLSPEWMIDFSQTRHINL